MLSALEIVIPAVVVFTTLFGLLGRGNPPPGGVALFLRVGLAGLALCGAIFYVLEATHLLDQPAVRQIATNAYRGLGVGGAVMVAMGIFGVVLKRKE